MPVRKRHIKTSQAGSDHPAFARAKMRLLRKWPESVQAHLPLERLPYETRHLHRTVSGTALHNSLKRDTTSLQPTGVQKRNDATCITSE